jgi:hypothetical protein
MNTNKWPVIKANENGKERSWAEAFPSSLKHRIITFVIKSTRKRERETGSFAASQSWRKQLDPRVACSKRETGNGTANGKRDTEHLLPLPGRRSGDQ